MGIQTTDTQVAALIETYEDEEFEIFLDLWVQASTYTRASFVKLYTMHDGILNLSYFGECFEEVDIIAVAFGLGTFEGPGGSKLVCSSGYGDYVGFEKRDPEQVVNHNPTGETKNITTMEHIVRLPPREFEAFMKDLRLFHYHCHGDIENIKNQLDKQHADDLYMCVLSMQWTDDNDNRIIDILD